MIGADAIERIAHGIVDRSLPRVEWTHAAHFAAVLWFLRHDPARAETAALRAVISRYNETCGTANTATSGYHETITIASTRMASAFLATFGNEAALTTVHAALMDSRLGKSEWLLRHWSKDLLFGPRARRVWVEPDVAPLVL